MSKINQLIQNLCPAGVEYKKLENVLIIKNGRDYKQFGDGNIPVYGSGGIMTYIDTAVYDKPSVLIPRKGSLDKLYYVDTPFWNVDTIFYTDIDTSLVEPKYIYYYLEGQHLERLNKAGGVPSLTQAVLNKVQLPVPPLEVQREIVRILDSFTLLTAELTAELTARKSQYEFYRRKLLTFDESIPQLQLRDVASFRNGKGHEKNIADNGKYVVVNSKFISTNGQVIKNSDEQLSPLYFDDIAMVMSDLPNGRALAKCYLIDKDDKFTLNQRIGGFHTLDENIVVTKYLFYILDRNWQLLKYDNGVDQTNLKKDDILNISIPVPAIDVQKRLVYMLDNFDAICSDLNIGLPAEIEARQKQYEYYRDVLLTYAATGKIIAQTDRQTSIIKLIQFVYGSVKISLGTIGKISMCKRIMKSETSSTGDVPFFKIGTFGGEPNAYISKDTFEKYKKDYSYPKKGDILISAAGTIGRTVVFDGKPAYFQDSNIVWIDNDESIVLNRYLYYYYQLQPWKASTGGTIARLYNDNIRDAVISVPSLSEQECIVGILDRFDALCNDLSSGLPAEIEARQKQYEYYRDRLLNFEPITE